MVFPIFLIRVISQIILNLDLIYLLLYLFQILLSFFDTEYFNYNYYIRP